MLKSKYVKHIKIPLAFFDETIKASRFRVKFLEIGGMITGLFVCIGVLIRYFVQSFSVELAAINFAIGLLLFVVGFNIKKFQSLLVPSMLFIFSLSLIGINAAVMNGGFYAPAVITITLCPLFGNFLGGKKFSLYCLGWSSIVYVLLLVSGQFGLFPVLDPNMEFPRFTLYLIFSTGLFLTGFSFDSARIIAENELQNKELQIRTIFESSPIGLLVADQNFEILIKNLEATHLLPQLAGKSSLKSALPAEFFAETPLNPNQLIAFKDDIEVRWLRFKIRNFTQNEGEEFRYLINVVDETDSVRADEMKKAVALNGKMAALGEMASGIAHEINNPLAIIFGKCSMLTKNLKAQDFDLARAVTDIDKIVSTTGRIKKIVSGLLCFAREGSGDQPVEVQVGQIIDDTLAICSERFAKSGIEIFCQQNGNENLVLKCRPTQISQVLINLLNNAYDELTLRSNSDLENSKNWVRIEIQVTDQLVQFTVVDSGKGIPNEIREKIFHPFFTTKPTGQGIGLGLSISKGLIEAHGGTLTCGLDSKLNQNTSFVVALPLQKAA